MQRAAHGLAYAVLDLLGGGYGRRVLLLVGSGDNGGDALYAGAVLARRGRTSRRGCCPTGRTRPGSLRSSGRRAGRGAGGRGASRSEPRPAAPAASTWWSTASSGSAAVRPSARTRSQRWTPSPAIPVVAVDTPSGVDVDSGELVGPHVSADVTVTFGTHKIAHLVDPAALRAASSTWSTSGSTCPAPALEALQPADVARAAAAAGPARAEVHARRGRRPRRAPRPTRAPRSSASRAPTAGWPAWSGTSAIRRCTDRVRAAHPEVVGDGRVQAWVVGSGSDDGAEEALRAALADDVPLVVDADALEFADLVDGRPGRAHAARRRARVDARSRAGGGRGESAPARPRRRRGLPHDGAAQGPAHARRRARPAGPGHHDRHPVARHRRRRRRARRRDRCAARRRPDAVRRRLGRVLVARRGRDPRLAGRPDRGRRRGARTTGGRSRP